MEIFKSLENGSLSVEQIIDSIKKSLEGKDLHHVLIIPPDYTRYYSNSGLITSIYYELLKDTCEVDIMPALGTHVPMTEAEFNDMYKGIPYERVIHHNWRTDVIKLGEVPASYLTEITEGLWNEPIDVEINKVVMDPKYDLIISVGQVVPHEVVGMANHAKNLFVGVGGKSMINSSHMVGAVWGMERMMGRDHTPVRKIFDYALEHYLNERPIIFALTVTTNPGGVINTHGLFIGDTRKCLEEAIKLAQIKNLDYLEHGIKKAIVLLDPKEFHSTWLGNKAIYRTRMAIADDGELIVLAPSVKKFGEDDGIDALIRKYGYIGRLGVLDAFNKNKDLQDNMSAAAHLIHGSSDGRFKIYYAVKEISKEEIASVNFIPLDLDETWKKYDVDNLKPGYNTVNGEEVYYIPNPALGLWINKEKF